LNGKFVAQAGSEHFLFILLFCIYLFCTGYSAADSYLRDFCCQLTTFCFH